MRKLFLIVLLITSCTDNSKGEELNKFVTSFFLKRNVELTSEIISTSSNDVEILITFKNNSVSSEDHLKNLFSILVCHLDSKYLKKSTNLILYYKFDNQKNNQADSFVINFDKKNDLEKWFSKRPGYEKLVDDVLKFMNSTDPHVVEISNNVVCQKYPNDCFDSTLFGLLEMVYLEKMGDNPRMGKAKFTMMNIYALNIDTEEPYNHTKELIEYIWLRLFKKSVDIDLQMSKIRTNELGEKLEDINISR